MTMPADFDPLKAARINTLHAGIESIAWDQSPHGFRCRDAFYQAIADVNLDYVSKQTEKMIRLAGLLSGRSERVA